MDGPRERLGRTLPSEAFVPASAAAEPAPPPAADALERPALERPSVSERLRELGFPAPPSRPRFAVGDLLGVGATAHVFAATDGDLERPVAIKLLNATRAEEDVAAFLDEARITASLEHPNVLPVHDVEVNSRGQVFFTMKRIEGRSLGAALEVSTPGARQHPLDDVNALVSVFIGVCQGLAYAHRRGIVHRDVKPDNIMLGDFGEVLLVDWGSAARLDQGATRLYGTPLYMSPEQARRERADQRSDVYCVGATLFHALTGRVPTWSDDPDEFWRLKRAGAIREPTAPERARAPAALLAIALKALSADAQARYADAGALLEDLRRYQGGLAVSALRESPFMRLRRWHRRHARTFWSWTAAMATILALAGALYGQRLEEIARWGMPTVEAFDGNWGARWRAIEGEFSLRQGRMVSAGEVKSLMVLAQRLQGAAAIEYEAEMLPGAQPGDISLVWARELETAAGDAQPARLKGVFTAQVGAYYGSYCMLTKDGRQVAHHDFHPQPGRRYRVRVEIEDNRLSLAVDGQQLCEWIDPFPIEGGYMGFLGLYPGKAFGDLRIYQREVPKRVPATAIGDAMARAEQYQLAETEYERLALSHPATAIGDEARFKLGLCHWRDGQREQALKDWTPLRGGAYENRIRLHEIDRAYALGEHANVLAMTAELYPAADMQLRHEIALQWQEQIDRLGGEPISDYLALHDRVFPAESLVDHGAAEALLRLDRYDELRRRYPGQRDLCAESLMREQRYDEVIDQYPDQRWPSQQAAFDGGMFERISEGDAFYIESLWMRGRADEIIARFPQERRLVCHALLATGRAEVVLRDYADVTDCQLPALCALGRAEEVAAMPGQVAQQMAAMALARPRLILDDPAASGTKIHRARMMAALQARAAGDPAWRTKLSTPLPTRPWELFAFEPIVVQWLILPFIDGLDNRDGKSFAAFDQACVDYSRRWRWGQRQRPSFFADYLRGAIDDAAFLRQPFRAFAPSNLLLARAMRAERLGDRAAALADYRAFLATPIWSRDETVDATTAVFAEWRAKELDHGP